MKDIDVAFQYRRDEIIAQGDSNIFPSIVKEDALDSLSVPGNLYEDVMKYQKYMQLSKFRKWLLKLKRRWRARKY